MQCSACRADVLPNAKFCSSCAAPLVKEEDIKSSSEVTIQWIGSLLTGLGYKMEPATGDPSAIAALHDSSPNLLVGILPKVSLITFRANWTMKKPGWAQKGEFLAALNKANNAHWLCTFCCTESFETLTVSSALFIPEKLSGRDVVAFVEMFSSGAVNTIQSAGLTKYG